MKRKFHKSKMCSMGTKQFITLFSIHISLVSWDTNLDAFGSFAQAHPALSSDDGRLVNEFDWLASYFGFCASNNNISYQISLPC